MKKIGLFLLLGFSLSWLVSACQERQDRSMWQRLIPVRGWDRNQ